MRQALKFPFHVRLYSILYLFPIKHIICTCGAHFLYHFPRKMSYSLVKTHIIFYTFTIPSRNHIPFVDFCIILLIIGKTVWLLVYVIKMSIMHFDTMTISFSNCLYCCQFLEKLSLIPKLFEYFFNIILIYFVSFFLILKMLNIQALKLL